jgi:hypothetical protein
MAFFQSAPAVDFEFPKDKTGGMRRFEVTVIIATQSLSYHQSGRDSTTCNRPAASFLFVR